MNRSGDLDIMYENDTTEKKTKVEQQPAITDSIETAAVSTPNGSFKFTFNNTVHVHFTWLSYYSKLNLARD